MNWQAISTMAEISGLLFLIVSVVYLGKQVRHTNTQAAAESLKDATQLYAQQYEACFGTKERAAFMRKALNDYNCLNQDEKALLFSRIMGFIGAWDNLYTKYQAGFLLKETYVSITIAFASVLQTPGGLACIQQIHEAFTLPPYIMNNTKVKSIEGYEVRPYTECLDFLNMQV